MESPPGLPNPDRNPSSHRSDSLVSCASENARDINSILWDIASRMATWQMFQRCIHSKTSISGSATIFCECWTWELQDVMRKKHASWHANSQASLVDFETLVPCSSLILAFVSDCKRLSRSHATLSTRTFAAICPRTSSADSLIFISGQPIPRQDKSCAERLKSTMPAAGHSGKFKTASKSDTILLSWPLKSTSCTFAECQVERNSFQK